MNDNPKESLDRSAILRLARNSRRTLQLAWQDSRGRFFLTCLIAVTTAVVPLIDARLFGTLLNRLTAGEDIAHLRFWIICVLVVSSAIPILASVRYFLERRNWYALSKMTDLMVIKKKAALDLATYESKEAQDIFMLYAHEGPWRVSNFVGVFPNLCWNGVAVITSLGALLFQQAWLCVPIFFGTLPVLLVELWSGEVMWGIFNARGATKRRFWHLTGCFQSSANLSELKTYQNSGYFISLLQDLFQRFESEELAVEERRVLLQVGSQIFYQFIFAYVLFSLVADVAGARIQIGTFTFLLAVVGTYRVALSGFFGELGRLRDHERFVDNVWKLLDLKPQLSWSVEPVRTTPALDIVFKSVTAGYPESPEPLFKDLNLTIKQGERVAIVGPNGAGKTTLRRLLQRDFDPLQGSISLGGQNLKDFDEHSLYSAITFLSQDSSAYFLKAKEAIAVGYTALPLSDEQVRHAADVGGAAQFIDDPNTLPLGYEQLLGKPDGSALSGGQWRRLAISRASYRLNLGNAKVLVLDEPTAQVDGQGAATLFKSLREDTSGRTVLLMTHLLADIRAIADRIVVLSQGRVIEDGTHEELMKLEGVYFDLFKDQAKGYPAS